MPKKTCVRTLIGSQHVKAFERLLKSARHYFSHIFLNTLEENQIKKVCFGSIWNLETVCYHIDTRWKVFCLSKTDCLAQPIQIQLPQNKKIVFCVFCCISGIYIKFGILWKKRWASKMISFWKNRLEKAGLLRCLKGRVSEHIWIVNMLKGRKDCLNLHRSFFVKFFHHSERNLAWKIQF